MVTIMWLPLNIFILGVVPLGDLPQQEKVLTLQCAQPVGRDSKQLLCERPLITSGLLFSWKCCSLVRDERSSLATGWLRSMLQPFKEQS